jgi:hypothetical protein
MTKLLEKAFKQAARLPETEQNALAKWVLEELKAERRWQTAFTGSEDVLDMLADEALCAHGKGETKSLNLKSL